MFYLLILGQMSVENHLEIGIQEIFFFNLIKKIEAAEIMEEREMIEIIHFRDLDQDLAPQAI